MTKYTFDGISTEQFNPQDKELFTETYDGTLILDEPIKVEIEDREIELHYFIQDTDMSEYEDTDEHVITVGVIPSYNSLSERNKESIISQFAKEDAEEFKKTPETLLPDVLDYGYSVSLHSVAVKEPEVEHALNSAIAVRFGITGLIGFELDKYINRIGNTGWDFLKDFCFDVDIVKLAINRYKERVAG